MASTVNVVASCPGKVLILGGYLIVEEPNVGISIGTTARFTSRVTSSQEGLDSTCRVHIISPQFGKEFMFECRLDKCSGGSIKIVQTAGAASPFLFYSVLYAVAASLLSGGEVYRSVIVELLADNDFYSQRNCLEQQGKVVSVGNLRLVPPHAPLVGGVSKTGLGSSAAMTSSVVASLYHLFVTHCSKGDKKEGVPGGPNAVATDDVELIHRVSQIAHCVAQGKVGSGFDVYTAVFGTCAYRRFPPHVLGSVAGGGGSPTSVTLSVLRDVIETDGLWVKCAPFRLPVGLKLLLGDVHKGGSETPGMVSKVMTWRKSVAASSDNLWEKLREVNDMYVAALQGLNDQARLDRESYDEAVQQLSHVVVAEYTPTNSVERAWVEAATLASRSRRFLREMGEAAHAPIEPSELTTLLDATYSIPGVFAVGCPGAGGYDAVFALAFGEEVCATVEQFWESYPEMQVCPLLVREDANGLVVE